MMKCTNWALGTLRSPLTAVVVVALSAAVCTAQELTGSGEWQSLSSELIGGTWTAQLTRKGSRIAGTLNLTGSNVFSGGDVAGEIDASSIVLGVMSSNARQATFSAKVNGDLISGEWQCDAVGDHGAWYGTLSAARTAP